MTEVYHISAWNLFMIGYWVGLGFCVAALAAAAAINLVDRLTKRKPHHGDTEDAENGQEEMRELRALSHASQAVPRRNVRDPLRLHEA